MSPHQYSENFQGEIRLVFETSQYDIIKEFYTNIIRLPIFKEFDHGLYQRGVVFKINQTLIEFLEKKETETKNNSNYKYMYIEVSKVNEFYKIIKDQIPILEDLQTYPWGHTSFSISDPDKNKLKFFSQ